MLVIITGDSSKDVKLLLKIICNYFFLIILTFVTFWRQWFFPSACFWLCFPIVFLRRSPVRFNNLFLVTLSLYWLTEYKIFFESMCEIITWYFLDLGLKSYSLLRFRIYKGQTEFHHSSRSRHLVEYLWKKTMQILRLRLANLCALAPIRPTFYIFFPELASTWDFFEI